ncbi:MAG: hypothetical protein PHZ02_07100 [Desulfocapsaceae bacterium]|nr:hypothetical protein [Desulfocapsaceae bacterium]
MTLNETVPLGLLFSIGAVVFFFWSKQKEKQQAVDKYISDKYKNNNGIAIKRTSEPVHKSNQPQIDCHACKLESGMISTDTPKFTGFIRFIGFIIVIPSILGMVVSGITFLEISFKGSAGGAMAIGMIIFFFCLSAVSGLLGWILLMKKKVFKCSRCGYILDRA